MRLCKACQAIKADKRGAGADQHLVKIARIFEKNRVGPLAITFCPECGARWTYDEFRYSNGRMDSRRREDDRQRSSR